MTVDAKASRPTSLVLSALNFYRSRHPDVTARCVRGGVSCSQRFERAFNEARSQGQNDVAAAVLAVDHAAAVCQEINHVSKPEAIAKGLILGTAAAIVLGGLSTASCSGEAQCPLCPGIRDCT